MRCQLLVADTTSESLKTARKLAIIKTMTTLQELTVSLLHDVMTAETATQRSGMSMPISHTQSSHLAA